MTLYKKQFGAKGEYAAVNFLKKKGYSIIQQNFRLRNGEIDIICLDPEKKVLVFVEVKTRFNSDFGTPFEAITSWKMHALVRTAEFFKHTHKGFPDAMRIDAIAVWLDVKDEVSKIEHLENVGY